MSSSSLKQQLEDQKRSIFFFNSIRREHRKQEELNKLEYDWSGKGHKVYPYKLDFVMCPYAYYREAETYTESYDPLISSYRKSRGSAIHKEFQDWFLKSTIIAPKPNIELEYPKSKLNRIWPEVPILYEPAMISGQADGIFFYKNKELCVLELKTTGAEEKGWQETFKWPLTNHQCQAFFYCDEITEQKYYDQPVKWACIAYLNTRAAPGDPRAEKEFYLPFDEEAQNKVKLLKKHLVLHREAYLQQEEIICTYPRCKNHAKKI